MKIIKLHGFFLRLFCGLFFAYVQLMTDIVPKPYRNIVIMAACILSRSNMTSLPFGLANRVLEYSVCLGVHLTKALNGGAFCHLTLLFLGVPRFLADRDYILRMTG